MEINRATLDKIAHLARLEFNGAETEKMMADMTAIVSWVEKLREVNTQDVEPLTNMSHEVNAFREDVADTPLTREQALARAPQHDGRHFTVPKVID